MARVPHTHNGFEAWIHDGSRGGYSKRIVLGNWFHKPSEHELCMVIPKGVNIETVKLDEMSIIQRDGRWYRVMRRPLEMIGKRPSEPLVNMKIKSFFVWPVPNEDGSNQGMFYVDRTETETIQFLILEGCTLKVTTINDEITDEYLLTCRESTYRRICDRYGLSRTEEADGQTPPVGEANNSVGDGQG